MHEIRTTIPPECVAEVARLAHAAGILATDPIAIVAAALFLPFLAQVLAVGLGIWSRDRRLILHGVRAMLLSTVLALAAGAAVAWMQGGPIRYAGFQSPLNSFFISCIIGVTAGFSTPHDTGRPYLVGVAAPLSPAVFSSWRGGCAGVRSARPDESFFLRVF